MRRFSAGLVALAVVAATIAVAPAGAHVTAVGASTVTGTCAEKDTMNSDGSLASYVITCNAKGTCSCVAASTVVWQTATKFPGSGSAGPQTGKVTATGKSGSLVLAVAAKATSAGKATGTWKLLDAAGYTGKLVRSGTFTSTTKNLAQVPLSKIEKVHITAVFDGLGAAA